VSQLVIYDTTLRDGTQREGLSLSADDKLRIAHKLDDLGVSYIEGGYPASNPKDALFFRRASEQAWKSAIICAFGMTRRKNVAASADSTMQALLAANTAAVAIVGKSWDLHVEKVIETTPEENLAMIADSVHYLRQRGRTVFYDAEHFFDGWRANPEYALATIATAAKAGAHTIILCDTNGGALPEQVAQAVRAAAAVVTTPLGIHAHNDGGVGVANTLAGVQAGCTHVQGTINGYGERCGNADLCSIIPNLELKLGYTCLPAGNLSRLTEISRFVAEVGNLPHDAHLPFVGQSAFAHKGGMHIDAIIKCEQSYQHIDPTLVGNSKRVLVSELAGKGSVVYKASEYGLSARSAAQARQVIGQIKELEQHGFQFEGAEGSFELLLRRAEPGYVAPFEMLDFTVLVEKRHGHRSDRLLAEATVKLRVGDQVFHTAAEGDGPVNALDTATRKALLTFYPELSKVILTDYKVRILDGDAGTAAIVRVLITSREGISSWNTVGSSTNIIEASWLALTDSLEYPLLVARQQTSGEQERR
jgi:2-isopropylmalate synthase